MLSHHCGLWPYYGLIEAVVCPRDTHKTDRVNFGNHIPKEEKDHLVSIQSHSEQISRG